MFLINKDESLNSHPDQVKWNEKYSKVFDKHFQIHPILEEIKKLPLPSAPILELACGLSGNVLSLASIGYKVLAVDISLTALNLLAKVIEENKLEENVNLLQADLTTWTPPKEMFSLVFGIKFWNKVSFLNASKAVINGGFIAWETFNKQHLCYHPDFRSEWCLDTYEPANLLTSDFQIISHQDFDDKTCSTHRLIAQKKLFYG